MKYTLGLDIGIASVGWCVINEDQQRIENLGVRTFDKAENPKNGSSLAEPRRLARGLRKRLHRKAQRMQDVKRLVITSGLISQNELEDLFTQNNEISPYQLRAEGLDRLLTKDEWARVLIHLAKHRGFKSNSKRELKKKDDDSGKMNSSIETNLAVMKEKGYRTAGEMLYKDEKFIENKRNKYGSYTNTLSRLALEEEIKILFDSQRKYGNKYAGSEIEKTYLDIFNRQKHYASGDLILEKIGFCTFEPEEKRAPKRSYTTERFNLLQNINKATYYYQGEKLFFTPEQRNILVEMALKNSSGIKYTQVRKKLELPEEASFTALNYSPSKSQKDPENKTFVELKGFHSIKKAINDTLGEGVWKDCLCHPEKIDSIAEALTYYKDDNDVTSYLVQRNISNDIITAILENCDGDISGIQHLSHKAMNKMMPYLEEGKLYNEAAELAGYNHSQPNSEGIKQTYLPLIPQDEIRNPVVMRALTQTRKVLNAIIREYGSPFMVNIELAREIGKNFDDRNKIEKKQEENRAEKERTIELIRNEYGVDPTGTDLLKYRLWREQGGFCAYSQAYLEPKRLFEPGYAEIDHIIPWSRSFDDSYNNKVLVAGEQNRNKGNCIPFEYFGNQEDSEKWITFSGWVSANIKNRKKLFKLLKKSCNAEDSREFKDRSLNDTRYISSFITRYIKENLAFSEGKEKIRVRTVNGQVTAVLRGRWGLVKNREEGDLHHALDAAVIASVTPAMIQSMTLYSKWGELSWVKNQKNYIDPETGNTVDTSQFHFEEKERFPQPWGKFRYELIARLSPNPAESLSKLELKTYQPDELGKIKAIFVSRAPSRKVSGPAHEDTIRSVKPLEAGEKYTLIKTNLQGVNLKKLEDMYGKERDKKLYEALKARLEQYEDDPKKAFAEVIRKPTNDGKPGPIVRSIKIMVSGTSGVQVNQGLANNNSMVRLDVFCKQGKYYLVPIYVIDMIKSTLPSKAIVAHQEENKWLFMDKTFDFQFSLYPNDLIRIKVKEKIYFGYYISCDRANGSIVVEEQSNSNKSYRIGVKLCKLFEKYQVDPLGNYIKVKKEVRRGLEKPVHQ